jgi:hypothetical protein
MVGNDSWVRIPPARPLLVSGSDFTEKIAAYVGGIWGLSFFGGDSKNYLYRESGLDSLHK